MKFFLGKQATPLRLAHHYEFVGILWAQFRVVLKNLRLKLREGQNGNFECQNYFFLKKKTLFSLSLSLGVRHHKTSITTATLHLRPQGRNQKDRDTPPDLPQPSVAVTVSHSRRIFEFLVRFYVTVSEVVRTIPVTELDNQGM